MFKKFDKGSKIIAYLDFQDVWWVVSLDVASCNGRESRNVPSSSAP